MNNSNTELKNILGNDPDELVGVVSELGEKKFRANQLFRWLSKGVCDFDEMSNLSKTFREKLKEHYCIDIPRVIYDQQSCTDGTLAQQEVKFSDGAAACVILASGGYPVAYEKGKPISGLVDGQLPDEENVTVYHAGTAVVDGQLVTNGGRVLGVTATGPRLTNALSHAYEAAEKISFEKLHKRSDIGLRALKALAEKQ